MNATAIILGSAVRHLNCALESFLLPFTVPCCSLDTEYEFVLFSRRHLDTVALCHTHYTVVRRQNTLTLSSEIVE